MINITKTATPNRFRNSFCSSTFQIRNHVSEHQKQLYSSVQDTQSNVIRLHRYLNDVRPKIAVLQLMKEKVQSAALVQKMLMQKRSFSQYQNKESIKRRKRSVQQFRRNDEINRKIRKQQEEDEKIRKSQQFRKIKEEARQKIKNKQQLINNMHKQIAEKVKNQHKFQKLRLQRFKLFKQRRSHSFHQKKLQKLIQDNQKSVQKIQELGEVWKKTQNSYLKARNYEGKQLTHISKMVKQLQDGLSFIKQYNIKFDGQV